MQTYVSSKRCSAASAAGTESVQTSAGDILKRAFFPRSHVDCGFRSQLNKAFKKLRNENDACIVGGCDTKRRVALLRHESLTKNGVVNPCKYFAYGDEEAVGSGCVRSDALPCVRAVRHRASSVAFGVCGSSLAD